jgi:hypothetical protein
VVRHFTMRPWGDAYVDRVWSAHERSGLRRCTLEMVTDAAVDWDRLASDMPSLVRAEEGNE